MNILLDPYILAVPGVDENRADDYLENLYQWTTAIARHGGHRFWLSSALYSALSGCGLYPNYDTIRHIESSASDKVYNVHSTLRACERTLFCPPMFDDLLANEVLYFEEDQVVVIPAAIAERLPEVIANALRETLAIAALGRYTESHPVFDNLVFATVPNGFDEEYLQARLEPVDIETETVKNVSEEWKMLFSPDELENSDELLAFWEDTRKAVTWACRQLDESIDQMVPYTIGARFNESIKKTHMDRYPRVMQALFTKTVKCLCGAIPRSEKSEGTPNHPIRKHRSHEKVKRHRDGAEAYRLHIQGRWRLHYWLKPDGSVELANVEFGHAMHIDS